MISKYKNILHTCPLFTSWPISVIPIPSGAKKPHLTVQPLARAFDDMLYFSKSDAFFISPENK